MNTELIRGAIKDNNPIMIPTGIVNTLLDSIDLQKELIELKDERIKQLLEIIDIKNDTIKILTDIKNDTIKALKEHCGIEGEENE